MSLWIGGLKIGWSAVDSYLSDYKYIKGEMERCKKRIEDGIENVRSYTDTIYPALKNGSDPSEGQFVAHFEDQVEENEEKLKKIISVYENYAADIQVKLSTVNTRISKLEGYHDREHEMDRDLREDEIIL